MAVRRLAPKRQGDLDGACGFYAITNAIRLVEPELPEEDIFQYVLESFLEDGDPMRFVKGTRRGSIKNTLSRTLDRLNRDYSFTDSSNQSYRLGFDIPYWQSSPNNRGEMISYFESLDVKQGRVSIIGYMWWEDRNDTDSCFSHWTVIHKLSGGQLHTFDSSHEKKCIPLDKVRIDANNTPHAGRPYNIYSGYLFVMHRNG